MARQLAGPHPPYHDTDAAGNCRYLGCSYNSDEAHWAAVDRGEDVYGHVPDVLPCAAWCETCPEIAKGPLHWESSSPCDDCPDCDLSLSAAEDATWD